MEQKVCQQVLSKSKGQLSWPGDLLGLSLVKFFLTFSGVITTFERSGTWQFKVGGIHSLSSRVKTLAKKLFNVLALSLGVAALDPSALIDVWFLAWSSDTSRSFFCPNYPHSLPNGLPNDFRRQRNFVTLSKHIALHCYHWCSEDVNDCYVFRTHFIAKLAFRIKTTTMLL